MTVNFLKTFENRVASIFGNVEAPFSFKKLAKRAAREMENETLVINGANTAPALYTILIAADDDPLMAPYYTQLAEEVRSFIKQSAEKKHYALVGEPLVRFMIDPALKAGKFSVFAENVDAPTLGRLYEEERAYQRSLQGGAGAGAQPGRHAVQPLDQAVPAQPAYQQPAYQQVPYAEPDPFEIIGTDDAPIAPAVQPAAQEALAGGAVAGMGGAAATGAAYGAAAGQTVRAAQVPARPLAQLVDVVTGDVHEISANRCTVGRERAVADIALSDPNVSRRHAELTFTGSDWTIEDLGSTNGTLVNNRRVTRCPLRNGDLLTFGLSTFEFRCRA